MLAIAQKQNQSKKNNNDKNNDNDDDDDASNLDKEARNQVVQQYLKENLELTKQNDELKQMYFFNICLNLKLNLGAQCRQMSVAELYETAKRQHIKVHEWPQWCLKALSKKKI